MALVTGNAAKHGTTQVAYSYLKWLYSPQAQGIIAQNYYRPRDPAALAHSPTKFPKLNLVTVDHDFGGWRNAQKTFFADGAVFDQIAGAR